MPGSSPLIDVPELASNCTMPATNAVSFLQGKRVAMVSLSPYPDDPRPRRTAEALLKEGMLVDVICLGDGKAPRRERVDGLGIVRLPIKHRRGGKLAYAYEYGLFLAAAAVILALRSFKRRYDLVWVHNMPDVLVASALVPKMAGAKVILDQHDPMPELMTSIFGLDQNSFAVRLMRWLEKWSIARANQVITVNLACRRIFAERSCSADKIGVVMNAPDDGIFGFEAARTDAPSDRTVRDRFVIMYHGSIVERNGLDLAVDGLARVRKSVPGAELRIYGPKTAFLDKVMSDAQQKGLQDCVHHMGPRRLEELVPEIRKCDLGIIPNQRNAFTDINTPTRIFEYLSLGKPVVAPRTRGILDYFGKDSLFFFESGNVVELAAQIERAFFNPAEALETARRGQEVYLAHTWQQERQGLITLVCQLLGSNRSKRPPAR